MLSYNQIIKKLEDLSRAKKSGTFFIKTQDNKSARFTLAKGQIIGGCYRMDKGYDALPSILTIESGSISFTENLALDKPDSRMPKTVDLLKMLSEREIAGIKYVMSQKSNPGPSSQNNEGLAAKSEMINDGLKSILTEYVGPMAGILCSRYNKNTNKIFSDAGLFEQMIDELSAQIDSESERVDFKSRVLNLVKNEI